MSPLPGSPAGPLWKEMPIFRAFSTYPPGSPVREPSLHGAPIERNALPAGPLSAISQSPR